MAEVILLVVAKSVIAKLTSLAIDLGYNYVAEEIKATKATKKDLETMASWLAAICAVLQDAEERQYADGAIKVWLRDLKSLVYEIDNLMDITASNALRRHVVNESGRPHLQLRFYLFSYFSRLGLSHKLRDLREKLAIIKEKKITLALTERPMGNPFIERDPLDACAFVNRSHIIGRDEVKLDIMRNVLLVKDSKGLSVLPIVGMGGLGKTALAKLVFHDVRTFDLKLWACVSTKFEMQKTIEDIIKSASDENTSNQSLEQLRVKIQSLLNGKKYFLVLDDFGLDDYSTWIQFKDILAVGKPGSVILITTRDTGVANITHTIKPYNLEGLPDPVAWSIFEKLAFTEGEEQRYLNLVKIGKSIVHKCGGIPLAVKTLGSMLRNNRDELEWQRIDNMDGFAKLHGQYEKVKRLLKLSYDKIPYQLKPCFAFCSLIAKDVTLGPIYLSYYWSALGLLKLRNGDDDIESCGYAYFMELLSKCLFQEPEFIFDETVGYCKVHDLLHDLATDVMGEDLAVVTSNELEVSEFSRNVVWGYEDRDGLSKMGFPKKLHKAKNVQTFRFSYEMDRVSTSFLEGIISKFTHLRILDLAKSCFEVLPSSVGNLKQLRYLDISYNPIIRSLPDTVCKLLNLQTLRLLYCDQLEKLPKGIDKLLNLKQLSVTTSQTSFAGTKFRGLSSLQRLGFYSFQGLTSLGDDSNFGCLTFLHILAVVNCPRLTRLPNNKEFFSSLKSLEIANCEELDLELGEGLHGVNKLRSLDVTGVPRLTSLPHGIQSAKTSLRYLFIDDCWSLIELPHWLCDFTSLKKLIIKNCPNLLALPEGFDRLQSLQTLVIDKCPPLSQRCAVDTGADYSLIRDIGEIWLDGSRLIRKRKHTKSGFAWVENIFYWKYFHSDSWSMF